MSKTIPNFATIHAATVAGFKWAPDLHLFVRVTEAGDRFKVEIQPPTFDARKDLLMACLTDRGSVRVSNHSLWHGQEGILGFMPVLNKYMGKSTPLTFYMDEDGQEVAAPAPAPKVPIASGTSARDPKEMPQEG